MAITYVNDLRLSEMDTGDNSGSWGTVTNTNLELIGEAFGFGTESITTNADTHASTIADGSTDPARAMYVKYTGALDSNCTVTIGPNTVNKFYFIENATTDSGSSGPYSLIISQGSGANITVPNGQTKAVYLDGAGSGAAVVDAFAALNVVDLTVQDDLTVTDDVSIGGTLGVTGVVTANAGVVVDEMTIDGDTITATDDFIIDAVGDIELNADGNEITFKHGSDLRYEFKLDSTPEMNVTGGNFTIQNQTDNAQILFKGSDDGAGVTALTLDMSNAGAATFNHLVAAGSNGGFYIVQDSSKSAIRSESQSIVLQTYASSAWNDRLTVANGGDVTIATGGDLLTNTASGTTNTRIGTNAGDSIVASNAGTNNIMIGANAGTAVDSGDTNICIGVEALEAEDDHANNIAIGYQALHVQDSGRDTYNIAIGYQAGLDNTTGFRNVLIGAAAGAQASTADSHMAIGYNAGGGVSANPLTGNENTCIGYAAGQAIEGTTANNTFVGSQAGTGSTTGYENVALGYRALYGNVQGRHNVAIGVQALDVANPASATSQYNTAVGAYAGLGVTTGAENTLVGGFAGRNITDSNYNTMLGYSAGYYNTTGAQNTFLGNSAAQGVDATKLTGDNNTALGYKSGFLLQGSATLNTYVGSNAGAASTTVSNNTFIGAFCGDAATSGDNTGVGSGALGNSLTGDQNTAVGHDAANGLTSGTDNVMIGHLAGVSATSCHDCTMVGEQAGGGAVITGDDNTFVGRAAGYNVTSGTNNLFLGVNAGRSTSPSGTIVSGSGNVCLGDDNINALFCADTSISSSDSRDKADITDFTIGLNWIKDLRPVTYKWDKRSWYGTEEQTYGTPDGSKKKSKVNIGFLAQEALEVEKANGFGDSADNMLVCNLTDDGQRYGMKYERLVPILVNAIKELSAKVETLETKVAALEG
jgi:hypothetical protein